MVVGAGLAGLVAALRLAQGGRARDRGRQGRRGPATSRRARSTCWATRPDRVDSPREALAALRRRATRSTRTRARAGAARRRRSRGSASRVPGLGYAGDAGAQPAAADAPSAWPGPRPWRRRRSPPATCAAAARFAVVGLRAAQGLLPARCWPRTSPAPTCPAARRSRRGRSRSAASPRPGEADVGGPVYARALDDPDVPRARWPTRCGRGSSPASASGCPRCSACERPARPGPTCRSARRAGGRDPDAAALGAGHAPAARAARRAAPRPAAGCVLGPDGRGRARARAGA